MSIRQFETYALPNGGVLIQFPLRRAGVSDIGWSTYINFNAGWPSKRASSPEDEPWRRIGVVVRETTRLEDNRLRRILKQNPVTRDKVFVYTSGTSRDTYTNWTPHKLRPFTSRVSSSKSDSTEGLKFDPFDLYAMLNVVHESGVGQPLGDWLVETETDFAPYIREAGWLPKNVTELMIIKNTRDTEYKRKITAMEAVARSMGEAQIEYATEDEENRWR